MPCEFCTLFLAKETTPPRYCSEHARLYVPSLGHWCTAPHVPSAVVVAGACDHCRPEAPAGVRPSAPALDAPSPASRAWQIFLAECVL